jgi:hypothetical protein
MKVVVFLRERKQGAGQLQAGRSPQGAQFTVAPPQHFLYFFPEPHGHGSFRSTLGALRRSSLVCALALTCRCFWKYRYAATSLGLTDKRRVLALQFQP